MMLWRRYDVQKFDTDPILFREIQFKKWDILMFKQRFQWGLGWNQENMQEQRSHMFVSLH